MMGIITALKELSLASDHISNSFILIFYIFLHSKQYTVNRLFFVTETLDENFSSENFSHLKYFFTEEQKTKY